MPSPDNHPSLVHKIRVEVLAAWLAARDPRTPWFARLFGLAVTAYALSPIDLIPDFIPVLGLVDDAILIPVGLWLFLKMLPDGLFEECKVLAEERADQPRSLAGAAFVLVLWVAAALLVLFLVTSRYS